MFKRFCSFLMVSIAIIAVATPGFATETSQLNEAVLFLVNDPQQLSFCDMNLLVERNKMYQKERGTLKDDQIAEFFQKIQEHGVVDAGTGANPVQVAYVVQNQPNGLNGVLVIKGKFDQQKVTDLMRKNYQQHSTEHEAGVMKNQKFAAAQKEAAANPFTEVKTTIDGHNAHIFPMPLRDRELIVVSGKDVSLISSANRGNRELLKKTIAVVDGKLPMKSASSHSKVVMTFAPDKSEKVELEKRMWARYDKQRTDTLAKKKHLKKFGERFRQRVIRNKVQFFADTLDDLQDGTLTIERDRENQMTKVATLVTTHESADAASEVKKRLMKHMIKEIKRNDNVNDKFALGNISITTKDNQTVVRCQLKDSKEQLHAFNLISSYVAKGMLERM